MSCSAFGCTKRHSKESAVQFFRFPLGDDDRLTQWVINVRRTNWTPSKSSRLCTTHFEEDQFFTDKGKRRLKDTAVPTIFNFPPHLWKRKKTTSRRDNEAVTNIDNGDSGSIPSADHNNAIVKQETAEETNVVDSVLHDDIVMIDVHADVDEVVADNITECTTSGVSQTIMHDHTYLCITQQQISVCTDHSYTAESPRTLKRKADAVQDQLVIARKKLRLKCQQTRRMKSRLLSLKDLTKVLQKKLIEKNRAGLQKPSATNAVQDQLVVARKKLRLKSQQTRRMKSRLLSLKDLTKVLQKKLKEKNRDGLQKPSAGIICCLPGH